MSNEEYEEYLDCLEPVGYEDYLDYLEDFDRDYNWAVFNCQ